MGNLCVNIRTIHFGTFAVAALLYGITIAVLSNILKNEYVVKPGVESLDKNICLSMAKIDSPVY